MGRNHGNISGPVKDPSGAVIPDATAATNPATNVHNKTVTDGKGFYAYSSLPVGRYNLRVDEEGLGPQISNKPGSGRQRHVPIDLTLEMAGKLKRSLSWRMRLN
jgi:hypothetical protein